MSAAYEDVAASEAETAATSPLMTPPPRHKYGFSRIYYAPQNPSTYIPLTLFRYPVAVLPRYTTVDLRRTRLARKKHQRVAARPSRINSSDSSDRALARPGYDWARSPNTS